MPHEATVYSEEYRGRQVEVKLEGAIPTVQVDEKGIEFDQDSDTGEYISSTMPYARFGTLEELGRAVVDQLEENE